MELRKSFIAIGIILLGVIIAMVSIHNQTQPSRLKLVTIETYGGDSWYKLKNVSNETLYDVTIYDANNLTVRHYDVIEKDRYFTLSIGNFSTPFKVSHGDIAVLGIETNPTMYHFLLQNTSGDDLYDVRFYDRYDNKIEHFDLIRSGLTFKVVTENSPSLKVVYADGSSEIFD